MTLGGLFEECSFQERVWARLSDWVMNALMPYWDSTQHRPTIPAREFAEKAVKAWRSEPPPIDLINFESISAVSATVAQRDSLPHLLRVGWIALIRTRT